MAVEKLKKINTRLKNKPGRFQKLKTIKRAPVRPQTQHKYPEHMYLKFLTPSIENIVNLHGVLSS